MMVRDQVPVEGAQLHLCFPRNFVFNFFSIELRNRERVLRMLMKTLPRIVQLLRNFSKSKCNRVYGECNFYDHHPNGTMRVLINGGS